MAEDSEHQNKMQWLLKRAPYFALTLMASYAAHEMPPDQHPYSLTACAFGLIFGVYGLVGGEELRCSVVKAVVDATMDFVPLSMVNIEIFLMMGRPYAMVHALFIIPLILDLIAKLFGDEGDDETTQSLKHVNNLANVVSLATLSYLEDNYMYGCVALSIVAAQTGRIWGGKLHGYASDFIYVLGYTMFYFATILAVTVPNEPIKVEAIKTEPV